MRIAVTINGRVHRGDVEPRTLLSDFIRAEGLTGTNVGCEHGVCGACTVQLDEEPVRSCLMLAVQADGRAVRTIEALALGDELHPLQRAFQEAHALQCGFCTPGMMMTARALLDENPNPTEAEIRTAISGGICRCTGYKNIVAAIRWAAQEEARV